MFKDYLMRRLLTDNGLPIIAGISSILFWRYLVTNVDPLFPGYFYNTLKFFGDYWRLFGGWIDVLLDSSIALFVGSSLAAPIAYLFSRPHQIKVAATSALCFFILIIILGGFEDFESRSVLYHLFFVFHWLVEGLCVFTFVFAWAKVGCCIKSMLKKSGLSSQKI